MSIKQETKFSARRKSLKAKPKSRASKLIDECKRIVSDAKADDPAEPTNYSEFEHQQARESYIDQVFFDCEAVVYQAGANALSTHKLSQKLEAIWEAIEELGKFSEELRAEDFPLVCEFFRTIGNVPVDLERRLRQVHAESQLVAGGVQP